MKLFFAFVLMISMQAKSFAQSFAISADKMNIAYIGIDNPLTIVSDNCSCIDLFATTANGTLVKKDSCRFSYMPSKMGSTSIIIQKKQNGKLVKIGEQVLRCKYIPDPRVAIGGKSGGTVPLEQFKVQQGITTVFDPGFEMDLKFTVTSFRISIYYYQKDAITYSEETISNRFSRNTIAQLNQLKSGDRIVIESIKLKLPDNSIRPMNPMVFTMR